MPRCGDIDDTGEVRREEVGHESQNPTTRCITHDTLRALPAVRSDEAWRFIALRCSRCCCIALRYAVVTQINPIEGSAAATIFAKKLVDAKNLCFVQELQYKQ